MHVFTCAVLCGCHLTGKRLVAADKPDPESDLLDQLLAAMGPTKQPLGVESVHEALQITACPATAQEDSQAAQVGVPSCLTCSFEAEVAVCLLR